MDKRARPWTPDIEQGSPTEAWLSATAAAAALGVSQRTIRRAIARGALPATKHGGVYRIAPADLTRYAPRRPAAPPATRPRRESPRLLSFPRREDEPALALPRALTPLIGRERE